VHCCIFSQSGDWLKVNLHVKPIGINFYKSLIIKIKIRNLIFREDQRNALQFLLLRLLEKTGPFGIIPFERLSFLSFEAIMTFKKILGFLPLVLAATPVYSHAHVAIKNLTLAPTQATVHMEADRQTTAYLALVGYGASCGSVAQTMAAEDSRGYPAYRSATVTLDDSRITPYTLRNLIPSNINYLEEYTLCLTDGNALLSSPFALPRMTEYPSPVWDDVFLGAPGLDITLSPVAFSVDGTAYIARSAMSAQSGAYSQQILKYQNNDWKAIGQESGAVYGTVEFSPTGELYTAYFKESGNPPPNDMAIEVKKFDGENWALVGAPFFSSYFARLEIAFSRDAATPYLLLSSPLEDGFGLFKLNGASVWEKIPFSNAQPYRITEKGMTLADDGTPYIAFVDMSSTLKVMKYDGRTWLDVGQMAASSAIDEASLAFSPEGSLYLVHHLRRENRTSIKEYLNGYWNEINSEDYNAPASIKDQFQLIPTGNGSLYLSYREYDGTRRQYSNNVKRIDGYWDWDWETVFNSGFMEETLMIKGFKLSPDGVPYLSLWNQWMSNGEIQMRNYVKRLKNQP